MRLARGPRLLMLFATLGLCSAACSPAGEGRGSAEAARVAAESAPHFTLDLLGGGSVSSAELRGKTIVLDFWATWCPPCEFQVPELNAFYGAHRSDSDVVVYGVSVDRQESEVVQAWVDEKQVHYPILLDGEDLAREFGVLGFPTLFVITPDGQVDSRHIGLIESVTLEEALQGQRRDHSS
jgi:peroxiredoxin